MSLCHLVPCTCSALCTIGNRVICVFLYVRESIHNQCRKLTLRFLFSAKTPGVRDPKSFSMTSIINCHHLSGVRQHPFTSLQLCGAVSDTGLAGAQSGAGRAVLLAGVSRGESISLPLPASGGRQHSLARVCLTLQRSLTAAGNVLGPTWIFRDNLPISRSVIFIPAAKPLCRVK